MANVVPLSSWYPAMHAKWQARLAELKAAGVKTVIGLDEREAWVHHHSVGGAATNPLTYARQVADMHWNKWQRPGGYNFLIGTDGQAFEMCGWSHVGAHSGTLEWNRKGLGLCFQGDYRTVAPSDGMLDTARSLIAELPIDQTYHRAVRPEPTTCPGGALIALLPLEVDMPLSADDLKAIANLLDDKLGPVGTITDPNGTQRPFHQYTVNGVWHATAGGKRMMDHLLAAGSETPVDDDAIAQAVVTAMTPSLRAAVAAELAKLTLKAQ